MKLKTNFRSSEIVNFYPVKLFEEDEQSGFNRGNKLNQPFSLWNIRQYQWNEFHQANKLNELNELNELNKLNELNELNKLNQLNPWPSLKSSSWRQINIAGTISGP